MDASRDAEQTAGTRQAAMDRFRTLGKILVIDVAAPLATYYLLRSAGFSPVSALLLSGVVPALGFVVGIARSRHIDVVGALVLTGIVVGTVLGLISHSAKLVLMEGSVPTAIFGLGCLGTLWTKRPLMYGLSLEFIGHDTRRGREMIGLRQYAEFRRIFRIITAVWGVGFLLEAAVRAVIVYNTSPGTALAISKVMPYIWVGLLPDGRSHTALTGKRRANGKTPTCYSRQAPRAHSQARNRAHCPPIKKTDNRRRIMPVLRVR